MTLAPQDNTQLVVAPTYEEPAVVLARATKQADALMQVVRDKQMFVGIQDKMYLEVEAWQLVAAFTQAHAIPRPPEPLYDNDGNVYGYSCTADVYQHGELIGAGTSITGLDSNSARDREGTDRHKAAQSTAQTHAISKALRDTFGFVAKLAGFEATTAEEMRSGGGAVGGGGAISDPMMYCPVHETEWFKTGRMRQTAHPVVGETGPRGGAVWCNQDDVIQNLGQRIRNAMRTQEWTKEQAEAMSKEWAQYNPKQKLDKILSLEAHSVDGATGELKPPTPAEDALKTTHDATNEAPEGEAMCGLCSMPMSDEDGPAHKSCMDRADADDAAKEEARQREEEGQNAD